MSAVLDTHTVLWYLEDSQELSAQARTVIEDAIREARDVVSANGEKEKRGGENCRTKLETSWSIFADAPIT